MTVPCTHAMQDDDLRELRDRREWIDALTEVKGGMSRDMKIGLRSEAKVCCTGLRRGICDTECY